MEQRVKPSARIAPLPVEHTPELKDSFEAMKKNLGFVPNSMLILQRKPKIARALAQLTASIWEPGGAVDFTIAAASVPNGVTDEMFAELRKHWSENQIVEIIAVISTFGFLNRWNDTMGTPLEEEPMQVGEKFLAPRGWSAGKHALKLRV